MTEVMGLPATFGEADTDQPASVLAINTGLWICRFDGDWPARFPGFRIDNAMVRDESSDTLTARVDPEDWIFGEWCRAGPQGDGDPGRQGLAHRDIPVPQ